MPMKKAPLAHLAPELLERRIYVVRGVRVMLDQDLAELYAVPTKRLNEQVVRNADRFPAGFSFLLTQEEFANLRSQFATSSSSYGGRRYTPRVFTEHGVAMLSGVLRSETAVRVNIEIMRAFVRMRRLFATPGELVAQVQALADTVAVHDGQIRAVIEALQQMMAKPPVPPKRPVGFHTIAPTPAR